MRQVLNLPNALSIRSQTGDLLDRRGARRASGRGGSEEQAPLQPKTPQGQWSRSTIEKVRARIPEMLTVIDVN